MAHTPKSVAVRVTPSITGLNGMAMKKALTITRSTRINRRAVEVARVHELAIAAQQGDLGVGHPAQQEPDPQQASLGEEQDEVVVERQGLFVAQANGDGVAGEQLAHQRRLLNSSMPAEARSRRPAVEFSLPDLEKYEL